ncbi:MAG: hypothetical protein V3R98_07965, partial [Alphaproteobacteria bacterium]
MSDRPRDRQPLPVHIDAVPCGGGTIGLATWPGRDCVDEGGGWGGDLDRDLAAIRDWRATALVSLVEDHEFGPLTAGGFGDRAEAQGLDWHHLPFADNRGPDDRFERLWTYSGPV